ncbi:hypothetical protein NE236_17840 [Actinoallomurus purpureus]|uniref:hypothetical protein n=1 Tax=Actinoallomurus purpureus TaxID=478114 RepID=UPI0020920F0B|nr:hypothetical protein [Actinoallomurus purpureus]MCO6006851.1 hypothetical protein [Actinoallomurus purpureus]
MRRMPAFAVVIAAIIGGFLLTAGTASARPMNARTAVTGATTMADHCTGFCVSVYNGTSKGIWMRGNVGQRWVPPHTWSDKAHPEMKDVDELDVPYGCDLTYQGKRYRYGQTIRIHGWSPYVWIYGAGC